MAWTDEARRKAAETRRRNSSAKGANFKAKLDAEFAKIRADERKVEKKVRALKMERKASTNSAQQIAIEKKINAHGYSVRKPITTDKIISDIDRDISKVTARIAMMKESRDVTFKGNPEIQKKVQKDIDRANKRLAMISESKKGFAKRAEAAKSKAEWKSLNAEWNAKQVAAPPVSQLSRPMAPVSKTLGQARLASLKAAARSNGISVAAQKAKYSGKK